MRSIESGNFYGEGQAPAENGSTLVSPETLPRTEESEKLEITKKFQEEEKNVLNASEYNISIEKNPIRKAKKFIKIASYFLTSTIAFGAANESLFTQADIEKKPNEISSAVSAEAKNNFDEKLIQSIENERKGDFAYIKETIEKNNVGEKIDYITNEYGTAPGKFLKNARSIVEKVKKIENDVRDEKPGIFCNQENPYWMTEASQISSAKQSWTDLTPEEKKEKSKTNNLKINGFEDSGTWPNGSPANDEIKSELEKIYPPQWLGISEIAFHKEGAAQEEVHGVQKMYGIKKAVGLGVTRTNLFDKAKIDIFPHGNSRYVLLGTIHHELAHTNDWEDSQMLSTQQRLDFLCDTTKAIKSSKNFSSDYVSNIKNEDKKIESYLKVKEYWAESVRQYIEDSAEKYRQTNPVESKLVEKWFNIINDIK